MSEIGVVMVAGAILGVAGFASGHRPWVVVAQPLAALAGGAWMAVQIWSARTGSDTGARAAWAVAGVLLGAAAFVVAYWGSVRLLSVVTGRPTQPR